MRGPIGAGLRAGRLDPRAALHAEHVAHEELVPAAGAARHARRLGAPWTAQIEIDLAAGDERIAEPRRPDAAEIVDLVELPRVAEAERVERRVLRLVGLDLAVAVG